MKLSEVYTHPWFEKEGMKCCFVCGKEVERGGLWYGGNSNPKNKNIEDQSTVICGDSCQEKVFHLLMDSLLDTRKYYYTNKVSDNDEELLIRQLRADMMQILELALTKKLLNIRLRKKDNISTEDILEMFDR